MIIARSVAFLRMAFFRSRVTVITQTNKSVSDMKTIYINEKSRSL